MKISLNFQGLYLLQTREFVDSNKPIYKIGRSNKISQRLHRYPNGSIVHLVIECKDSKIHESQLINLFKNDFKLKPYYGLEYFIGDKNEMINTIIKYITTIYNNVKIIKEPIKIYKYNENDKYILFSERAINNIVIENNEENDIEKEDTEKEDKEDDAEEDKEEDAEEDDAEEDKEEDREEDKEEDKIKNNLSDRTCGTCHMSFEYPYLLERHLNGKRKCKPVNTNKNTFHCQHCNNYYASKYSITNHFNICKSKKEFDLQNQIKQENFIEPKNKNNNIINKTDLLNIISKNQEIITNNPSSSNTQDIINQNNKLIEILSKLV